MKIYFLELILTTKCNQTCEYCNVYNINNEDYKLEIDLDFLKYILKQIPQNTKIEFCGGEPGILTNLNEAFHIVNANKNIKFIQVMSNGLVRLNNYDWLNNKNVFYCEHLIQEIDGKNIVKFYNNLDFIKSNRWKYVIVTTNKTINSLLENFDYYEKLNMFDDRFWYKIMNPKTKSVHSFIQTLEIFFKKLKSLSKLQYIDFTLDRIKNINEEAATKSICNLNSPLPAINFETKELLHCGAYLKNSLKYEYTLENFNKHLKCDLFKQMTNYCKECYIYSDSRPESIISCKKGNYYNQIIKE